MIHPKILKLFVTVSILCNAVPTVPQETNLLTVGKIFQERYFYPSQMEVIRSMADGEHYTALVAGNSIIRFDYLTGLDKTVLFDTGLLPDRPLVTIDNYEFSRDEKKILIATNKTSIYRYSFEARYWIYDRGSKTIRSLADTGKQQLATLSPDGSKVAFVMGNNLYYKDLMTNSLVQVTTDGKVNSIINGAPDWVYEEEFGFSKAFCWSADSRKIAFYRFDESQVKEFDMTVFNGLYPVTERFKYPKAGEVNSTVTIHVYNIASKRTLTMDTGEETDQYIPRIKWSATPDKLCIIRLNRLQNKVDVTLADAGTGTAEIIFSEENSCYISEINDDYIHFTSDQQHFIIMSERSGFFHYYLYALNGRMINRVTQGNWEVQGFLGLDESHHVLYYLSNQSSVLQQDVFSVNLDGTQQRRLSMVPGTNTAKFSSNFQYYINTWSDANTPPRYTLHRNDGSLVRVIEDNGLLVNKTKNFGFSRKEFIKIPLFGGPELFAYLIKPADFDSTKKYPLFISVYGGPESQDVRDSWDNGLAWQQLLAQQGIIVACIDNRGTNGRGEAFRKITYKQLGKFETEDQVNAARYLGGKSWIDETRIGIWGWSYGGYMTLLCLTKGAGIFSMGIAVAPVTNWRFYDTIYTERFMQKPQDNPQGYDDNSPINHAGKLRGKLLLVHGTADDNVHLQNSVEMAEKLVQENIQFQMFLYPNKNHSIYGGNTRNHLYEMMTEFIRENL
jgi:dipeptidyl-peptidase-4